MTLPLQGATTHPRHHKRQTMRCINHLLVLLLLFFPSLCWGARHSFVTRGDARTLIGPIGAPFGFLSGGIYNLTVFDYQLKSKSNDVEAGFILKKLDSESHFSKYQQQLELDQECSFQDYKTEDELLVDDDGDFANVGSTQSALKGIFLSMKNPNTTWKPNTPSVSHEFTSKEEGLYFLLYQVCGSTNITKIKARSTFELNLSHKNFDQFGYVSYLTAGEMPLPLVFLYFSISYAFCLGIWATNIWKIQKDSSSRSNKPKVYPIHHLMTVLLALKMTSVLFESIRYHYIKISGHAELWSIVYYTLAFIKGTFLFTVILLIGSGWSFVKPFLNDREKKVICVVLALQVVDNIAVVVLSHETEGESWYDDWSAVLHLVDILCCCAVLVPIVWQVNSLEKALGVEDQEDEEELTPQSVEEEESVRTLSKLRLFRSFYLLVVGYIYFTRIVVYLFSTVLGYRHTWIRYLVTELGTLLFYTVTGILFKPMDDNPYLALKRDEDQQDTEGTTLEMGKLEMNLKD